MRKLLSFYRLSGYCCFFCFFLCGCSLLFVTGNCYPHPLPNALETAIRCMEVHQFQEAKNLLMAFLKSSPHSIDALLLYQDAISREPGNDKEKQDFQQRLASQEANLQSYLLSRQKSRLSQKIQEMEVLLLQKPSWHLAIHQDLAKAYLESKEYSKAREHIKAILEEEPCMPQAHILYSWYFLHVLDWNQALSHARIAKQGNPYLVKPYFFEAASEMVQGNYFSSLQWFKKIRILFPSYKWDQDEELGCQSAFWREISSLKRQKLWNSGLALSQEALEFFPKQSLFLTYHAEFLLALNQKKEAEEFLAKSLTYNPYHLSTVQLYRRMLLEKDCYPKAFEIWERIVPKKLLYHDENSLSPIYKSLKDAFQKANTANAESLCSLAKALESVGWEIEARIVYQKIPGSEAKQKQLSQKIGFFEDLETFFSAYYDTGILNIAQVISYINKIAKKNQISLTTYPSQEFSSYFVLVREADPFDPKPGSLGDYLLQANKVLDLGNNYGHIDARIMNRLSLRKHNLAEENLQYQSILGDETLVDNYLGYQSGSSKVAGRAFLSSKGFYVALDTIRPSLGAIKYLYARMKAIPLPSKPDNSYSTIANDLLAQSFRHIPLPETQEKWDILYQEFLARQIETVHKHELGHVKDFPCFLPLYQNWDNLFTMLWRSQFSPEKIHTRFESVAEIFGLTHSQYPHYYLSQLLDRLDVDFSGLFELVHWAWYGTPPEKDPYYQTAKKIFQDISQFLPQKTLSTLPSVSEKELEIILKKLYKKSKYIRVCE